MKKFSKSLILPIAYPVIPVILLLIYFLKDLNIYRSFVMRVSAIMLITSIAVIILTVVFTKKFNKSFILPVTYAAIAVLLFIYSLHEFDFDSYELAFLTYILVYLSLLIFAVSIEAFILIAVFDLNLKRNFFIYIISVIVSIISFLIGWHFYGYNLVLDLVLGFVLQTAKFVLFVLRKTTKPEIIVWFLLDPFLAFFIMQSTVLLSILVF